jgi:hypothetical protein
MKINQFYKIRFFTLLILLGSNFSAEGNTFYDSLPNIKREEITVVDDHTVEVGIGPDDRSVSCNILDAVQSIPYVDSGGRPMTVFVNKENIHLINNELYTWDREGKYRVRLTTKYIREFGNIRIYVPKEGTALPEQIEPITPEFTSSYFENLPPIIKEEITIIDENMVEVAIGPDDRSLSTTIIHAINSIPSVKQDMEPDQVFVNGEQVYYIKKGFYTWDEKGKNPVRLTSKYIRKFGNIQIHVPGDEFHLNLEEETGPTATIEPTPSTEPAPKNELVHDRSETTLVPETESSFPPNLARPPKSKTPPAPEKIKNGIVKGFRLAQFGMNEGQVVKAIFVDFNLLENEIEKWRDPETGHRVLTIASLALDPAIGKAWIHYHLSSHDEKLNRVNVVWGHPDHSNVDKATLQKSAERFKNLFTQFRVAGTQAKSPPAYIDATIFYGIDSSGKGIEMIWAKPMGKNFQPISQLESTLVLNYFKSHKTISTKNK